MAPPAEHSCEGARENEMSLQHDVYDREDQCPLCCVEGSGLEWRLQRLQQHWEESLYTNGNSVLRIHKKNPTHIIVIENIKDMAAIAEVVAFGAEQPSVASIRMAKAHEGMNPRAAAPTVVTIMRFVQGEAHAQIVFGTNLPKWNGDKQAVRNHTREGRNHVRVRTDAGK